MPPVTTSTSAASFGTPAPASATQTAFQANVAATPTVASPTSTAPVAATANSSAIPSASIVPPASTTQSTNVTTLGQPTINSSSLPTPAAYTPPPVPDLSTITAAGTAPTASQGEYSDITSKIGALTDELGGQTAFANDLNTKFNVPALTATANDLSSNISQIQQQRDSVQQQLADQYGTDASKGYL